VLGGKGQECQMTRPLDGHCQTPLMLGARASLPARLYFSTIGQIAAQHTRVLVINAIHVIHAKSTDLGTSSISLAPGAPARCAILPPAGIVIEI